ncbi:MAG: aminotransferase class I/II-fold pyridoxal phosphate-dependent enzyme [Clostridiales bacterium]|nr:aminotransferase class I/II-fold pyridoxal phosphate-dependent enzyme [Clostridiales bacterium]
MKKYLDEKLREYSKSDIYPFHMPGHKRQRMGDFVPEDIDITEIEGFDDLHHAEGILMEGQQRLALACGADESFYLVNGSTAGILSAICGCIEKGDRILIGRNCHKSVYNAAYLMEAKVEYLYPEPTDFGIQGAIPPEQVEDMMTQHPDIRVVVITSPTYDGIVSDIGAIAEIVHGHDGILIVDEAHGAHFGFSDGFPKKAIALGADLCVESLHKTLPAYTQSAALHMKRTAGDAESADIQRGEQDSSNSAGSGDGSLYRFNPDRVKRYLDIFQSSSPSYVLMAGIDRCVRIIEGDVKKYRNPATRQESLFAQFEERLEKFYKKCDSLKAVEIFPYINTENMPGFTTTDMGSKLKFGVVKDNSKILISATEAGLSGPQLCDLLLSRYHLQPEMAAPDYVTALTSIMDTDEGFDRLYAALSEIDAEAGESCERTVTPMELYAPRRKCMEIAQAMDAVAESVLISEAVGRISAGYIYLYPPGIPIIAPGEVITEDVVHLCSVCKEKNMHLQGSNVALGETIVVVWRQHCNSGNEKAKI